MPIAEPTRIAAYISPEDAERLLELYAAELCGALESRTRYRLSAQRSQTLAVVSLMLAVIASCAGMYESYRVVKLEHRVCTEGR